MEDFVLKKRLLQVFKHTSHKDHPRGEFYETTKMYLVQCNDHFKKTVMIMVKTACEFLETIENPTYDTPIDARTIDGKTNWKDHPNINEAEKELGLEGRILKAKPTGKDGKWHVDNYEFREGEVAQPEDHYGWSKTLSIQCVLCMKDFSDEIIEIALGKDTREFVLFQKTKARLFLKYNGVNCPHCESEGTESMLWPSSLGPILEESNVTDVP